MIDFHISQTILNPPGAFVYPDQEDYVRQVCPICDSDGDSYLVADIRCNDLTSLQTAFCKNCEHWYLQKLPSMAWYQNYYAETWDITNKRVAPTFVQQMKSVIKKVPFAEPVFRYVKQGSKNDSRSRKFPIFNSAISGNIRAIETFTFLFGVVEDNGHFYRGWSDIHKILEIGCGHGDVLSVFHKKGFDVVGTEASLHRAQYCRSQGLNVVDCPVDNLTPIAHLGPFDFAYSTHVLEHIANPGQHIQELSKHIRDGGYLYIQVPHLMHEVNFIHSCHTAAHVHSFSPRSLALLLAKNGFTPVRMEVDTNVHLLVRKVPYSGTDFGGLQIYRNTADPIYLLDLFKDLVGEQDTPLRFFWDHADMEVKRVSDNETVFKRSLNFNVLPIAKHTFDFTFRCQDEPSFPIHFHHQGTKPPFHIKQ